MQNGRTICLFGDSGSGKTTQAGELAKYVRKSTGKNAILYTSDLGGYRSIAPLVKLGVVTPVEFDVTSKPDEAWIYVDDAVGGKGIGDNIGLAIFDSATSMSEMLLTACHKADFQIGQQRTQKFSVSRQDSKGGGKSLNVSINNEAHYGVVQGFMLDKIWQSTWLTRRGIDVLWTFSVHRGEEQDRTPILGPKLAGKALTAAIPKWFQYTFRIASLPREGEKPLHRLYLTEAVELAGLGHSFGNARYPLDATTDLPAYLEGEDCSIAKALDLVKQGQDEAEQKLKEELGL